MASASRLAHLPVGSGYRSSFNGLVVTVFGPSGHIGRHVVNRLGREGTHVVVPTRSDDYYVKDLKVCGDLGAVKILPMLLTNEETIYNSVKHSDVVINCINRQFDRKLARNTMADINADGAGRLARISKEAGVERFVHLSAVGANQDSASPFLRTKGLGEEAVKSAFPDATIVRTCDPVGYRSRTLRFIRKHCYYFLGFKPTIQATYRTAVKYPVGIADVAHSLVAAATLSEAVGRTYELVGRDKLTVAEMYDLVFASLFKLYFPVPLPEQVVRGMVKMHEFSARIPFFTCDEVSRLYSSEEPTPGLPGFEQLGITPESAKFLTVEAMRFYRPHYYEKVSYEDVIYQQQQSTPYR